ncbi:hypothetical protein D3C86_1518900 [compost metagenome]
MDHDVALGRVVDVVSPDDRFAAIQDEHLGVVGLAGGGPGVEGHVGLDPVLGEGVLHGHAEGVEVPVEGDVDLEGGILGLLVREGFEEALGGGLVVLEVEGLDADLVPRVGQQRDHLVHGLVLGVGVVDPDSLDGTLAERAGGRDGSLGGLEDGPVDGGPHVRSPLGCLAHQRVRAKAGDARRRLLRGGGLRGSEPRSGKTELGKAIHGRAVPFLAQGRPCRYRQAAGESCVVGS